MTLAIWLRTARAHRGMSLEDVCKVTKIQPRILVQLEAGNFEGLPAEVFVRGFVRSFAKAVGLDESEALQRYSQCGPTQVPPTASAAARGFVETMSDLAPATARATPRVLRSDPDRDAAPEVIFAAGSTHVATFMLPETGTLVVEPAQTAVAIEVPIDFDIEAARTAAIDVVVASDAVTIASDAVTSASDAVVEPVLAAAGSAPIAVASAAIEAKKKRRRGKGRGKRVSGEQVMATGTPAEPPPVVPAVALDPAEAVELAEPVVAALAVSAVGDDVVIEVSATGGAAETVAVSEPWAPKMPTTVTPTISWRRPFSTSAPGAALIPSLVIDDSDPDSAERELEERAAAKETSPRRSFLPPILLDREDRSARQGGLTLAVIILLIAATLTLSYLMRRPSSSGDGVTQAPRPAATQQLA